MSQNTEHDWVEQAKRGEAAGIAELYRHYWRAARAAAYGVTGDLPLAEDAAAEAFEAAFKGLPALREVERFGPWLRTIVIRTARRLKAARAVQHRAEAQRPIETAAEAANPPLDRQELAALVQAAVAQLPQIQREAISLFYFEGYNVEDAARFLGVPTGTFKRRLHDGRRRLRETAERISQGEKPMDPTREQVLQQLRELIDKGGDADAIHRVMREALGLRPVPQDLLRALLQKRVAAAEKALSPQAVAERQRLVREHWDEFTRPSPNALDPEHPVGAAVHALRAALPEFEERPGDVYPDFDTVLRRVKGEAKPVPLPPGFAEGRPVSYLHLGRGMLIQDQDGSARTQFELLRGNASREELERVWRRGLRVSDVLVLSWLRPKPLELREVEALLRRLSEAVAPGVPVSFTSYEEPRYRAALRMQIADLHIPGATGGILDGVAWIPDDADVASVLLYLEAWASTRSGQTIGLAELPFPLSDR